MVRPAAQFKDEDEGEDEDDNGNDNNSHSDNHNHNHNYRDIQHIIISWNTVVLLLLSAHLKSLIVVTYAGFS